MMSITPPPLLEVKNNNNDSTYRNIYAPNMNTLGSQDTRHIVSFRRHPFETADIFQWLQTDIKEKQQIGQGSQSAAYKITTRSGTSYILRTTPVAGEAMRKRILHEMKVYEYMFEQKDAQQYISKLLYADCPVKDHDLAYFVFEHVEGLPLDTFLRSLQNTGQRIRPKTAQRLQTSLSLSLSFLERLGIVHRDIKPANLFLDSTHDRLLIFDFETSCFAGPECQSAEFVGTKAYATEEARRLQQTFFPNPYIYTHADDRYAAQRIYDADILPIVFGDDPTKS